MNTFYRYEGMTYDYIPVKHYYIDTTYVEGQVEYVYISKKMSPILLTLVFLVLLVPLVGINLSVFSKAYVTKGQHTMRVPSEIYYDASEHTVDLDITNDVSNVESVSIAIRDSEDTEIIVLKGIQPGDTVGAIPIEYVPSSLPMQCSISYTIKKNGIVYNDIVQDILLVDRATADSDENKDF